MSTVNIVITIILVAALILGWVKGFVTQLGSLCALFCAFIACRVLGDSVSAHVLRFMPGDPTDTTVQYAATIVGHVALFLLVWLLVWLVARLIHKAIKVIHLGWLNSAAGSLFMLLKWAFVLGLVFSIWHLASPDSSIWSDKPISLSAELADFTNSLLGTLSES